MTLEILICTINDGIGGVEKMLLARQEGLRYVVSWQQTDGVAREVPKALCRDDVRVVTMAVGGLSLNRNNAMAHATGDVCVIADDDMTLCADGLRAVVEKFEQDPSLDIATFKYASDCSQKSYPDYEFDLRRFPSGYYVASIEIAFRRASVVGKVLFDDHFGIGAPVLAAGEESVFLHAVFPDYDSLPQSSHHSRKTWCENGSGDVEWSISLCGKAPRLDVAASSAHGMASESKRRAVCQGIALGDRRHKVCPTSKTTINPNRRLGHNGID